MTKLEKLKVAEWNAWLLSTEALNAEFLLEQKIKKL